MPPEVAEESRRSRSSHVSKERLLQWQRKLAEKGWLCPNWPREYGGTGWNSTQKFIFEMEMARADLPYLSSFSIKMVAPVLMKYGSDAQKSQPARTRGSPSCAPRSTATPARSTRSDRSGARSTTSSVGSSSCARRRAPTSPTPMRPASIARCYERRLAAVDRSSPTRPLPVEPVGAHPWRASYAARVRRRGAAPRAAAALAGATAPRPRSPTAVAEVAALVPGVVAKHAGPARGARRARRARRGVAAPGRRAVYAARARRATTSASAIALIRARGGGTIEVPRDPATFVAIAARHRALAREVDDRFTDAVDRLDAAALWSQLKRWTGSVAPLRFVALRAVRARSRAAAMPGGLDTDDAMIDALEGVDRGARVSRCARVGRRAREALVRRARRDPRRRSISAKVEAAVGVGRRAAPRVRTRRDRRRRGRAPDGVARTRRAGLGRHDRVGHRRPRGVPSRSPTRWRAGSPRSSSSRAATGIARRRHRRRSPRRAARAARVADRSGDRGARRVGAVSRRARRGDARPASVRRSRAIERGDLGAADLAPAWERATLLAWADAELRVDARARELPRRVAPRARRGVRRPRSRLRSRSRARARSGGSPSGSARSASVGNPAARRARRRDRPRRRHHGAHRGRRTLDRRAARDRRAEGAVLLADARLTHRRPLRDVLASIPALLPRLAPCVLATPFAVAQHLDPALRFDVVVIDEAASAPDRARARGARARRRRDRDRRFAPAAASARRRRPRRRARGRPAAARARHALPQPARGSVRARERAAATAIASHVLPGAACARRSSASRGATATSPPRRPRRVARLRDPAAARAVARGRRARRARSATPSRTLLDAARATDPASTRRCPPTRRSPCVVEHVDAVQGLERDVIVFVAGDAATSPAAHLAVAMTRAREQLRRRDAFAPEDARRSRRLAATIEVARAVPRRGATRRRRARSPRRSRARSPSAAGPCATRSARGAYRLDLAVVDPSDPERYVLAIEHDGAPTRARRPRAIAIACARRCSRSSAGACTASGRSTGGATPSARSSARTARSSRRSPRAASAAHRSRRRARAARTSRAAPRRRSRAG